jgi:hypothetical protein
MFYKHHVILCDRCFERVKSEAQALNHVNRTGHFEFSTSNFLRISNNKINQSDNQNDCSLFK